ncbi:hypothetical protein H4R34_002743 [Dimargaris verticillata]|uniref:RING-type domain-containing protein n=1 Tax=Dimargaris verticillata TaxID=2761393 RepID=A0A9W8B1A2_9FUNG|nr:hypothetical protein H4R34_002743 [Dimargaris verticillata]
MGTVTDYQYTAGQTIDDDLYCSICHDVFNRVCKASRCGHLFCHACIRTALARNPSCPMCRAPLRESELVAAPQVQDKLDALTVYCSYRSSEPHALPTNTNSTAKAELAAAASPEPRCAWTGPRHALRSHLDRSCQWVPVWCNEHDYHPDCPGFLPRKDIRAHRARCQFKMVGCQLNCPAKFYRISQMQTFQRCQLAQHLETCRYDGAKDIIVGLRTHILHLERNLSEVQGALRSDLQRLSTLKVYASDMESRVQLDRVLRFNPAIRQLQAHAFEPSSAWQQFTELLQHNDSITHLYLEHSVVERTGAVLLAKTLRANTTLHTLSVAGNGIGDQGLEFLAKALEVNSTIRVVNLAHNTITDRGVEHLARSLLYNTSLTTLDLSSNQVKHRGMEALTKAMEQRIAAWQRASSAAWTLTDWVPPDDAPLLPHSLAYNSDDNSRVPVLQPPSLHFDSLAGQPPVMSVSSGCHSPALYPSTGSGHVSFQRSITDNDDSDDDRVLASSLIGSAAVETPTVLSSDNIGVRSSATTNLISAPGPATPSRRRRHRCPPEPLIVFDEASLARQVGPGIRSNQLRARSVEPPKPSEEPLLLRHLDLTDNDLGSRGAECLAQLLKMPACPLEVLYLGHTKVGARGAEDLVRAVECNLHLQVLILASNHVPSDLAMQLHMLVAKSRPTLLLDLGYGIAHSGSDSHNLPPELYPRCRRFKGNEALARGTDFTPGNHGTTMPIAVSDTRAHHGAPSPQVCQTPDTREIVRQLENKQWLDPLPRAGPSLRLPGMGCVMSTNNARPANNGTAPREQPSIPGWFTVSSPHGEPSPSPISPISPIYPSIATNHGLTALSSGNCSSASASTFLNTTPALWPPSSPLLSPGEYLTHPPSPSMTSRPISRGESKRLQQSLNIPASASQGVPVPKVRSSPSSHINSPPLSPLPSRSPLFATSVSPSPSPSNQLLSPSRPASPQFAASFTSSPRTLSPLAAAPSKRDVLSPHARCADTSPKAPKRT